MPKEKVVGVGLIGKWFSKWLGFLRREESGFLLAKKRWFKARRPGHAPGLERAGSPRIPALPVSGGVLKNGKNS
jgi:hypothetical protein